MNGNDRKLGNVKFALKIAIAYILIGFTCVFIKDGLILPFKSQHLSFTVADMFLDNFMLLVTSVPLFFLVKQLSKTAAVAEQQTEHTESYYQTILDNSFEGVALLDKKGRVVYQNHAFEKITGYSFVGHDNLNPFALIPIEDLQYAEADLQKMINDPGIQIFVNTKFIHRDGHLIAVEVGARSMFHDPNINAIIINVRDVTEKHQAREELMESERRYRSLFENSPIPQWIYDKHTLEFVDVNDATIKNYGYTREEFLMMTIPDIRPVEELPKLNEALKIDIADRYKAGLWIHRRKDGSQMTVDISITVLKYLGKDCRLVVANDITDQLKAEEILQKNQLQYLNLVENLPAGAVLVEGESLFFNKGAELITGYRTIEINTLNHWFETMFPGRHEYVFEIYKQDQANHFPEPRTVHLSRKNGELIWVTFYAYNFGNGEVWLLQDVTAQRMAEERIFGSLLEGEDKERQRISSELHDGLGQLLTVASMNFDSVKEVISLIPEDKQEQFTQGFKFLTKAIEESRAIAQNLMPMSIGDFGLIHSLESLFNNIRKSTPLTVTFHHNIGQERFNKNVETNIYRITQEAINNVIKHAQASNVTVQLLRHPHSIVYTFEDDGIGFDLLRMPTKGMGLTNMSNRVKALSGEMTIDSQQGQGTNIIVEVSM